VAETALADFAVAAAACGGDDVLAWRAWKIRPGLASTSSWVAQCQWPGFLPVWPDFFPFFASGVFSVIPARGTESEQQENRHVHRSIDGIRRSVRDLLALARLSRTNQPKCHASSVRRLLFRYVRTDAPTSRETRRAVCPCRWTQYVSHSKYCNPFGSI
jgi:hypothetical protein